MLKDKAELDYLNQQPTTFVLPPEAVDRLRAAAGTIIMDSPEFKRLLKDVGAKVIPIPCCRLRRGGGPIINFRRSRSESIVRRHGHLAMPAHR